MRGLLLRFIAFIVLTGASAGLYALPYLSVSPTDGSTTSTVARLD